DDATSAEKQKRLKECVRHQVIDAARKRTAAHAQKHIAELRDGGVSEDFFDVVLRQANGGGENSGEQADVRNPRERSGRVQVNGKRAGDHVDAGGEQGGGVD